jgi:hypothetical protein
MQTTAYAGDATCMPYRVLAWLPAVAATLIRKFLSVLCAAAFVQTGSDPAAPDASKPGNGGWADQLHEFMNRLPW